jgi:hypothetical protein
MVMYISMSRKGIRPSAALALCLCLIAPFLSGEEKTIELGKDRRWRDMRSLDGLAAVPGRWGFQDLALSTGEYALDRTTEMLFHFNSAGESDARAAYEFAKEAPLVADSLSAMGSGSAAFTGGSSGFDLVAPSGSLFSPGAVWEDFTIEMWLYPATLSNGETILAWEGSLKENGNNLPQGLRASFANRKLAWQFQDLFTLPTGKRVSVTLAGTRQLLPRVWHHHLLRFDSRSGILEYLLDGVPEAIAWITSSGGEAGDVAVPRIGREHSSPLSLGAGFTGFLDELRVSRRFVEDPTLTRFLGRTGAAVSSILDLGFTATRILRIEATTSEPGDSAVQFSYQVSDVWTGPRLLKSDTDWVPFRPAGDLPETVRGRYVQLMVELFPDGTRTRSPRVSSIRVVYEPNIPPVPPAGLLASPGNGKVTLSWRKSTEPGVRGYMVYYGEAPSTYLGASSALGAGASAGDSPIDAGESTRIEIGNLANGTLYYFAVVAYDSSEPRQQSAFSAEVSARPSRMFK